MNDCWTEGGTPNGNGYRTVTHEGRKWYRHRLSYTQYIGEIPEGMVIDHLCRNRACHNPDHLEAVTNEENILRGESPPARNARREACGVCGDTYVPDGAGRRCRACKQRTRTDTKRKGVGRAGDRTHCPQGHPYNETNTYIALRPDGSTNRMCRECARTRQRARRAKRKE